MAAMCTWKDCQRVARHKMSDDGELCLCDEHAREFNTAMAEKPMREVAAIWAMAHGGAERFVRRVAPGIKAAADLFEVLQNLSKKRVD